MKKTLIALSLIAASAAASAATYNVSDVAGRNSTSYATLATTTGTPQVQNFNFVMNVNDTTKVGRLLGTYTSGGATYGLDLNFVDPYSSGATQMWGYFSGTITGANGFSRSVVDTQGANSGVGRTAMDARMGINAGPYNTISNKFELGFWGAFADFNALATCTSATATGTGACSTTPGGNVPLPGSLALLGLGALGLGFARKSAKAK